MGRSSTPKYRVEYRDNALAMRKTNGEMRGHDGKSCHVQTWYGVPSYEALCKWREDWNKSFEIGAINGRLSEDLGMLIHIHTCAIVRKDGMLMFKYDAPMFEVAA